MRFFVEAETEYHRARSKHKAMQSQHEGLAVIWEEFEEFKQEVFKKKPDPQRLREELIQIAAMCRAFDQELLPQENPTL